MTETKPLHPVWTNALSNYTLQDTAGALAAVLAFTAIFYAPGYLAAYTVDLFGFLASSTTHPHHPNGRLCCLLSHHTLLHISPIAMYLPAVTPFPLH